MSQDPAPYKPKDTSGDEDVKKASEFFALCDINPQVRKTFGRGYYMPHENWGDRDPKTVSMKPLTAEQEKHLLRERNEYTQWVKPFDLRNEKKVFKNEAMAEKLATLAANAMRTLSEVVNTVVRDEETYPGTHDERTMEAAINTEWGKLTGTARNIGHMKCQWEKKGLYFDIVVTIYTREFSAEGKKKRTVNYVIIAELKSLTGTDEPKTATGTNKYCDQITSYANGTIVDTNGTVIPLAMMLIYRIGRHVFQRPNPDNTHLESAKQVHSFWWPTKRILYRGCEGWPDTGLDDDKERGAIGDDPPVLDPEAGAHEDGGSSAGGKSKPKRKEGSTVPPDPKKHASGEGGKSNASGPAGGKANTDLGKPKRKEGFTVPPDPKKHASGDGAESSSSGGHGGRDTLKRTHPQRGEDGKFPSKRANPTQKGETVDAKNYFESRKLGDLQFHGLDPRKLTGEFADTEKLLFHQGSAWELLVKDIPSSHEDGLTSQCLQDVISESSEFLCDFVAIQISDVEADGGTNPQREGQWVVGRVTAIYTQNEKAIRFRMVLPGWYKYQGAEVDVELTWGEDHKVASDKGVFSERVHINYDGAKRLDIDVDDTYFTEHTAKFCMFTRNALRIEDLPDQKNRVDILYAAYSGKCAEVDETTQEVARLKDRIISIRAQARPAQLGGGMQADRETIKSLRQEVKALQDTNIEQKETNGRTMKKLEVETVKADRRHAEIQDHRADNTRLREADFESKQQDTEKKKAYETLEGLLKFEKERGAQLITEVQTLRDDNTRLREADVVSKQQAKEKKKAYDESERQLKSEKERGAQRLADVQTLRDDNTRLIQEGDASKERARDQQTAYETLEGQLKAEKDREAQRVLPNQNPGDDIDSLRRRVESLQTLNLRRQEKAADDIARSEDKIESRVKAEKESEIKRVQAEANERILVSKHESDDKAFQVSRDNKRAINDALVKAREEKNKAVNAAIASITNKVTEQHEETALELRKQQDVEKDRLNQEVRALRDDNVDRRKRYGTLEKQFQTDMDGTRTELNHLKDTIRDRDQETIRLRSEVSRLEATATSNRAQLSPESPGAGSILRQTNKKLEEDITSLRRELVTMQTETGTDIRRARILASDLARKTRQATDDALVEARKNEEEAVESARVKAENFLNNKFHRREDSILTERDSLRERLTALQTVHAKCPAATARKTRGKDYTNTEKPGETLAWPDSEDDSEGEGGSSASGPQGGSSGPQGGSSQGSGSGHLQSGARRIVEEQRFRGKSRD